MEIKFNLNDYIKVKLTESGYERIVEYYNEYGAQEVVETFKSKADEDGYNKLQMWRFMEIFGPVTYLGAPSYFNMNIILLPCE